MDDSTGANETRGNGVVDAHSLVLSSPSSVSSSSTSTSLNTEESSISFFEERSSTLGALIGIARDPVLADNEHATFGASSNRNFPLTFHQSSATRQRVGFKSESAGNCIAAKLCGFFHCGACKGLCSAYADTCKFVRKKENTHAHLPGPTMNSASLGHLLVAERDAEKSFESKADSSSYAAQVYVNIMYEQNAGLEQGTIDPLFDTKAASSSQVTITSTKEQELQRRSLSSELGLFLCSFLEDSTPAMKSTKKVILMSTLASAAPSRRPPILACQKRLSVNMCEQGCISFMWTRIRAQKRCVCLNSADMR